MPSRILVIPAILVATSLVASCQEPEEVSSRQENPAPEAVVQAQLDAYNDKDIAAFAAQYADDVVVRSQMYAGKQALKDSYQRLFSNTPELHAKVVKREVNGNIVSDHEIVTGIGPTNRIHAVAEYRVEDGQIKTVTFLEMRPIQPEDTVDDGRE